MFSKPVSGPIHIGGGMGCLHGRDHRVSAKEREISRINHLCMFNSPAQIIFPFEKLTVNIQNDFAGRIADRMRIYLVSIF